MKRRDLFAGGSALAAAGLVTAALAPKAHAAPRTSPTIFDFGAVGNGSTDDSAAFTKALQTAAKQGRMVIVPGGTYAIHKPIRYRSEGNVVSKWGLQCEGAILRSRIQTGEDVMLVESRHIVRYLNIVGGLTIRGTRQDGCGVRMSVPFGGGRYLYNCVIDQLSVEGMGVDGLRMEGNVFENTISNSHFQGNSRNGATFAHLNKGIVSNIVLIGCYFNENRRYGMECTTFDDKWGGAVDVRVIGGYCRENRGYGFYYNNGTIQGGSVMQVGFENNCTSMKPGDPNGAHVFARVRMQMRDCMGYNESGGATNLLTGWFSSLTLLDGCSQTSGGAMRSTGKSRLVRVDGDKGGHVLMRGCSGGVSVAGKACGWEAVNCTGPSPLGDLKPRATVISV